MNAERLRMSQWLLLAILFYALTQFGGLPATIQTVAMKLGNVTVGAFIGYWIDRLASRLRITANSTDQEHLRRAIIMAAAMLCVSLGL